MRTISAARENIVGPAPTVVVLGGTGFVGRHVCEAFNAIGARVLPVSRSSAHPIDVIASNGPSHLAALLAEQQVDVVVNAAGRAWRATDQQMRDGNARLVERLVAVVAAQRQRPRLIQLSSIHEYGPGTAGRGTAEDEPARPVGSYGESKLCGTQAVLHAAHAAAVDGVVLRLSNVTGPGTPPGSLLRGVAEHLVEAADTVARGEPPAELRFASLRAWRDFVDVRDVADAVVLASRASPPEVAGQVVNIGRGQAVQVRWLVDRMVTLSGLPVPVVEDSGAATAAIDWQQLDVAKASRVLGWEPRRHLDLSLHDLLTSLAYNPEVPTRPAFATLHTRSSR